MNESELTNDQPMGDVQSLILELRATAANAVRAIDINGVPHYVVKEGYKLEAHPELLPAPTRRTGRIALLDLPSFCAYFNRFKNKCSLIYADTSGFPSCPPAFTGVINEDFVAQDALLPRWRDYTCRFTPVLSVEFKRWMAKNGQPLDQEAFVNHLADNMPLITVPPASEVLSLFEQLRGSVDVKFQSVRNLFNGKMTLHYAEDVKMTGGGTGEREKDMDVPSEIICAIQPFEFGQVYMVKNRVRYRVMDKNKLVFTVEAMDVHKVLADAAASMVTMIGEQTGTPVLMGKPD